MFRFALIAMSLYTTTAIACPDLTGTYNCIDSGGTYNKMSITYREAGGISYYNFNGYPEMPADGTAVTMPDTAEIKNFTYHLTCNADDLEMQLNYNMYDKGTLTHTVEGLTSVYLISGGMQMSTVGFAKSTAGDKFSLNGTTNCTRQ
jgi:hypothetical protein